MSYIINVRQSDGDDGDDDDDGGQSHGMDFRRIEGNESAPPERCRDLQPTAAPRPITLSATRVTTNAVP